MKVAVPAEILADEKRVAATPETVKKMTAEGLEVTVQAGAGRYADYSDEDYREAGARIAPDAASVYAGAGLILKIRAPVLEASSGKDEAALMPEGSVLMAQLGVLSDPGIAARLAQRKITALALELVPRIARAQKLDVLSSQANVAGYKAVVMAADSIGKMMPLMMTAAGTVSPAKVFIIGAGVAGLQAIATARRLGALVEAFDVRPVVKEQVESLGAKFVAWESEAAAEDKGGYAKELSKEAHDRERELLARHVAAADIVITTALIPGKAAPRLIDDAMVHSMRPGSVIVDLAAEGGGNCVLSKPGETVQVGGVCIIAPANIASMMPVQASQLFSRNILNLLLEMYKKKEFRLNLEDEIQKGCVVTHEGRVVHPALQGKTGA